MSRVRRLAEGASRAGAGPGPRAPSARASSPGAGVATALDLLAAACAAGASVTAALVAVGRVLPDDVGRSLVRAGAALAAGAAWDEAWVDGPGTPPSARAAPVADALRAAWETGAAPGPALRAAARTVRREEHARALEAAGRLGVRLVLPLGLCYLPAFVLVGLVPVLVSMASGGLRP